MNATLSYEPFKLPAGILALAVHLIFFALLYFGLSWQNTPPEAISVDLWQSLPEPVVIPPEPVITPPEPAKIIEAVRPAQPENIIKPDIALPDKKKKIEVKPIVPTPAKAAEVDDKPLPKIIVEAKPVEVKPDEPKPKPKPAETIPNVVAVDKQALRAAQVRQEGDAASKRMVDEYIAKIMAKIRRNIVEKSEVAKDARAEFAVTLLPSGMVLGTHLIKSSGDEAYDNAVERAILKAQPLPLPPDVALFEKFRELKLGFEPEK